MIYAATGHRPDRLGGYSQELNGALNEFAVRVLAQRRPSGAIVGMAQGWDQAVAIACTRLGIPFVAAIPFVGQERRWPKSTQKQYRALLVAASSVHVVCDEWQVEDGGVPWAMHERNHWMVDNSTGLLALWDGSRSGGTYGCVEYARLGRRDIVNVWDQWYDWWSFGRYLI